jgi:hypoxanthine phosphoribosyltransferase
MIRYLSEKITESALHPDIIIGILMGGLIPASLLSDFLGLNVDNLRVKFYKGVNNRAEKPRIVQDIQVKLNGKRVLLVDDVADTGKTIQLVKQHLLEKGAKKVTTCTLHYKPWSMVKPDIYVEETKAWIIYPWERMETMRNITKRLNSEGLQEEEIRKKIAAQGIPKELIDEFYKST